MSWAEDLGMEDPEHLFNDDENDVESDGSKNVDESTQPEKSSENADGDDKYKGLSKRMQRKMIKHERWLAHKTEKRKIEREKKKARKRELREAGVVSVSRKKLRGNTMANSQCKQRVAIDCSFDHLMTNREINSLGQQIQYSYSANRRTENPLQLYVTSLGSATKERLDNVGDYSGWDVHFKTESHMDVFDTNDLVYLSSDSPNVLEKLDESKVYIIGGLVDHNKHKGVCHQAAVEQGLTHAQLPIGQYLHLDTRKVLAVNHVFEILLQWTISKDWEKAFFHVIPKRKGLSCRDKTEQSSSANQDSPSSGRDDEDVMDKGSKTTLETSCGVESSLHDDNDQSSSDSKNTSTAEGSSGTCDRISEDKCVEQGSCNDNADDKVDQVQEISSNSEEKSDVS